MINKFAGDMKITGVVDEEESCLGLQLDIDRLMYLLLDRSRDKKE